MADPATIVALARSWIGTPYRHQASMRGAGADCLGLLRGLWREVCGPEPVALPAYTADWSEASGREELWRAAATWLRPVDGPAQAGHVLLFRMREGAPAKHLGVMGDYGERASFIHAYSGLGVVESPLSLPWERRIVAVFAFPMGDR